MEGERRKRKLEDEEEDSEEHRMEKFFALIRSTKDVRDRLSKEKENNNVEQEKLKNVWNPAFQPEDFIHGYQDLGIRSTQLSTHPGHSNEKELELQDKEPEPITEAAPPPPPHYEDKEKASEEDKLDLTLSL